MLKKIFHAYAHNSFYFPLLQNLLSRSPDKLTRQVISISVTSKTLKENAQNTNSPNPKKLNSQTYLKNHHLLNTNFPTQFFVIHPFFFLFRVIFRYLVGKSGQNRFVFLLGKNVLE